MVLFMLFFKFIFLTGNPETAGSDVWAAARRWAVGQTGRYCCCLLLFATATAGTGKKEMRNEKTKWKFCRNFRAQFKTKRVLKTWFFYRGEPISDSKI